MEKDSRRRRRTERDGKKKKARWLNKDGETGWAQTEGEKLKVKWAAKGMRLSGWRSERGKRGEYKMRRGFLFSFLAPFIFLHIFPSLYQVCTLDLVKHTPTPTHKYTHRCRGWTRSPRHSYEGTKWKFIFYSRLKKAYHGYLAAQHHVTL